MVGDDGRSGLVESPAFIEILLSDHLAEPKRDQPHARAIARGVGIGQLSLEELAGRGVEAGHSSLDGGPKVR
jgi:hypothetical protein